MGEQMNIKELAARVLLADPKELADAIGDVEETKRVLNRLGGAEQMKHSSPVAIIQRDYGYVFEAHEKNDTVLVRRVYGVKNPHYIASQSILSVKAVDGGGYRARLDIDGHRCFLLDLKCGYSRALSMAVRAAIGWHRISDKCHGKKGGKE